MSEFAGDSRALPRRVGRGVIGVLQRDDRYLMVRRADGVAKGGYWCFPGGHVEPGETPRQALKRELAEELGVDVEPVERLGAIRVSDPGYVLAVWRVGQVEGSLRLDTAEIAEARWLTAAGLRSIKPGLASNQGVFDMLGI